MIHIGFTGTRFNPTQLQIYHFKKFCEEMKIPWTFHHGDCIGADETADYIARKYGANLKLIHIHPPKNPKDRAYCSAEPGFADSGSVSTIFSVEKEYIERNHDIVDRCETLIAMPQTREEQQRSGTWSTIRYAKSLNKPLYILNPDVQPNEK